MICNGLFARTKATTSHRMKQEITAESSFEAFSIPVFVILGTVLLNLLHGLLVHRTLEAPSGFGTGVYRQTKASEYEEDEYFGETFHAFLLKHLSSTA